MVEVEYFLQVTVNICIFCLKTSTNSIGAETALNVKSKIREKRTTKGN